ncbi:T-cell surface glycoprotein CD8 alpha chain [Takifugu rubripes]|uniref:T-cell surface glycoprotein CD8alpha n=1 Tax=Takifugu rubripes TaxID=31033 RepID=Q2HWR4_TAKRU|nr:T-cell surface glycoprotein CD8 alpha chain [Takifugu rubripes]BAE79813.1 T-cell surface glycoprotein CD8alpha [Takifugu rubripes]|eukprot:NP_001072086.1 T-cell surface glycoprotein CD8 alpha chain [Takifugu rubripes]
MEQKWRKVLVFLVFCQQTTPGDNQKEDVVKEGAQVDIHCQPSQAASMTVWFRVRDNSWMEFIGSFSNGLKKTENNVSSEFTHGKINRDILTLKSFQRQKDSGLYCCASLYKGKELRFGPVTQLRGETVEQKPTVAQTTPRQQPVTTAPACTCDSSKARGGIGTQLSCAPLILGPLAGGCGLLLLLLIVTALYCNRVRTRRCPHHYKRKPRGKPPGNK